MSNEMSVETQELWQELRGLSQRPDVQRLCAQALAETAAPPRFTRSRLNWSMAASMAICVLAAAAFFVGQHYTPAQRYATGPGQRSTIVLDDGSQVILNVDTKLDVKLGKDRRELSLKAGEAVFTVAQETARPFVVIAGDGAVTALGTRFQVRDQSNRITVTLLEGRVAVDRADRDQHVQLNPGDEVKFVSDGAALSRRTVDPEIASSWTTGRLKFRATPLAEVLAEVNRYTKTRITLKDTSLAQTPVNGMFEMGNSASVVSALQIMMPIAIDRQDRGEIVLTRR